jgi:hypothetical protein
MDISKRIIFGRLVVAQPLWGIGEGDHLTAHTNPNQTAPFKNSKQSHKVSPLAAQARLIIAIVPPLLACPLPTKGTICIMRLVGRLGKL